MVTVSPEPHYSLDVMGLGDTKCHVMRLEMSCKHPLKGFYTFQQNSLQTLKDYDFKSVRLKSNRKIKVVPYRVNHLELIDGRLVCRYDDEVSRFAKAVYKDFTEIPCGRCIECRLKRSREWANRCMLELPYHESSYFLTLTYDDNHLRYGDVHDENGFLVQNPTLYKKDLQDFFKRLRKNYKYDNHLKYYACGEYGDNTMIMWSSSIISIFTASIIFQMIIIFIILS